MEGHTEQRIANAFHTHAQEKVIPLGLQKLRERSTKFTINMEML
jgi:hypothetical protein